MNRHEALNRLYEACERNLPDVAEEALSQHPDLIHEEEWGRKVARSDAHKVVPVLAKYHFPLERPDDDFSREPMREAIWHLHVNTVRAIADAGVPLPPRKVNRHKNGQCETAFTEAMTADEDAYNGVGVPSRTALLMALRELGADVTWQPGDDHVVSYWTRWGSHIKPLLDSGSSLYAAFEMPPPTDPLHPDLSILNIAIYNTLNIRPTDSTSKKESAIIQESADARREIKEKLGIAIREATDLFPTPEKPADAAMFFDASGALKEHVYRWESLAMLPLLFSPESEKLWKNGTADMMEVYERLPAHVQRGLNMPATLRETPTPREHSVTVHYAHATQQPCKTGQL